MTLFLRCVVFAALALMSWCAQAAQLTEGPFSVVYEEPDAEIARKSLDVLIDAVAEYSPRLPLGDEQVTVVIAATIEQFRQAAPHFRQLNVSGVAKSEESLIILKSPRLRGAQDDYRGTIRHELVHILLYRNANTGQLPRWLNEGTAMMLANEYRWASTLTVGKMFLNNRIIAYRDLDNAFLAPGNETEFGDAYAQALSMTRFLRDEVGDEAFFAVLLGTREMSFPDALRAFGGLTPLQLWNAYHGSLWRVALVGTLTSGSLLGPAGLLVVVAWWRKRRSNRRIINRWEEEERATEGVELFNWDDVVEGPYDWENSEDEDDEGEAWKRR